jgi:hypothetical protein
MRLSLWERWTNNPVITAELVISADLPLTPLANIIAMLSKNIPRRL